MTIADRTAREAALADLLHALDADGYAFVPPTPATHAHVVARPDWREAHDLRGVFGWSLPFDPAMVTVPGFATLAQAEVLVRAGDGRWRSTVRVARLHGRLFVHSAYPTDAADSVFLGPDSYRFADFIVAHMPAGRSDLRIADYGAGAGVGGIVAACHAGATSVTLADVNPRAVALAALNARHAGLEPQPIAVRTPADLDGLFDVVVTHPPFMIDPAARAYRDGGDLHGGRLSCDWAIEGSRKLAPGGRLIMHTGAAIVDGEDVLLAALRQRLPAIGFALDYRELDPDIFGEEMGRKDYAGVERLAAVGAVVTRMRD